MKTFLSDPEGWREVNTFSYINTEIDKPFSQICQ